MSHFVNLDTIQTGSNQETLDDRLRAENDLLGLTGNEWNSAFAGGERFNFNNPFTGNLAGVTNGQLEAILHAIDQLQVGGTDTSITQNNLANAAVPLTVPINTQDLTFDSCGNVNFDAAGNAFDVTSNTANINAATVTVTAVTAVSDVTTHTINATTVNVNAGITNLNSDAVKISPGSPGKEPSLELVGATNSTIIQGHESATEPVVMSFPATQPVTGIMNWDDLGRIYTTQLSLINTSVTGEAIHQGTNGPTGILFKTIKSADASINVSTDAGAIDLSITGLGGRNRGQYAATNGASVAWPTTNDGNNHVGQPFLDDDYFTIAVTNDAGGESFVITDGATPVTVKTGDTITLTTPGTPTATSSWLHTIGSTQIADSNMMSEDLTNSTNADKVHNCGENAWTLLNATTLTLEADSFDFQTGFGVSAITATGAGIVKLPNTVDGTQVKTLGLSSNNEVVTFTPADPPTPDPYPGPVAWHIHILTLNAAFPKDTIIKLDGSTVGTTLEVDGSLTWAEWPTQASMAADPYFRCLADGLLCDLHEIDNTWCTMKRNGTDGVTFTTPLSAGAIVEWRVPIY